MAHKKENNIEERHKFAGPEIKKLIECAEYDATEIDTMYRNCIKRDYENILWYAQYVLTGEVKKK